MTRSGFLVLLLTVAGSSPAQVKEPGAQRDVPYVVTSQAVIDAMFELAKVGPGDVLVDLGAGDGRIPISAAQRFGIKAVGVEINEELVRNARLTAEVSGVGDKVSFHTGDLFEYNLKEATVVTVFLLPSVNLRLRPKLLAELKPGARIITHKFDMGSWQPDKAVDVGTETVYVWTVPERGARVTKPVVPLPGKSLDELRKLYEYEPGDLELRLTPRDSPAGVKVSTVGYKGSAGRVSGAFVQPAKPGRHPAVVFLHDAGRKHDQFLAEAIVLAQGPKPIGSLLIDSPASRPAGWRKNYNPMIENNDRNLCIQAVVDTRIALDLLSAQQGINPTQLAVVGHGYGAMWAAIVSGIDARAKGAVLLSPMASIADGLASDDPDSADLRYAIGKTQFARYILSLRDLDLPPYLSAAQGKVLLQFGRFDPFLAYRYVERLPKGVTYDAGQDANHPQAWKDRQEFLLKILFTP